LEKYPCPSCGGATPNPGQLCPNCDAKQRDIFNLSPPTPATPSAGPDQNKFLITLLLCLFVGNLGVHRFYTGHIAIGVVQLLTGGGCLIWWLIDFILIVSGSFKDAEGNPIKA
jgi:TM2 domain-containing membrane protein YozV